MENELAYEFNKTAAEAYEAFPLELHKLVVFLDAPVFVSPAIAGQLTKNTAEIKAIAEDLANEMHDLGAVGIAPRNRDLGGTVADAIFLDANPVHTFSSQSEKEMELLFTLDHEIGHHILKNGQPVFNVPFQLAESAADAYAMLRHIQRFGKNTAYAESYGDGRAFRLVVRGDTKHYTTDSVERAIQVSNETDISGLSLRDTAALAERIADECELDLRTPEKIRKAFEPAYELYEKAERERDLAYRRAAYQEVVSVMRANPHDPDIFKAGKRALNYSGAKEFVTESAQTTPYWKDALDFMQNHKPEAPAKPVKRGLLRRIRGLG